MPAKRVECFRTAAAAAIHAPVCRGGLRVAATAAIADHRLDGPLTDLRAELVAVVAAVSPQLRRQDLSLQQPIQKRQQMRAFVLIPRPDPDPERDPARIDDQVETAARAAAERAADLAAPFFVSTNDASTIARDQSLIPSASNSCCTRTSSRSHTPARRHS